jgi:hypothetical protein
MSAKSFFIASFSALTLTVSADTIVQWNFNSVPSDANATTGVLAPSFGSGTASTVGGATGSFAAGSSSDTNSSSDNSGLQTTGYPAVTGANKSAGARFDFSTVGYTNIVVSWWQRNSATASKYARLQYTVDGNAFYDANALGILVDSVFTNIVMDISSLAGTANNSHFGIRIVSEWEYTATLAGTNAFVATKSTSTYSGSSGTMRFDLVTVTGTLLSGANAPPTISQITNQTLRVNQPGSALPLTVGDAEDLPTSLALSATSSDTTVLPVGNIVFGGSGSNRTVTMTGGNQPGTSAVVITVTDTGGKTASTAFNVTVLPLNTPPVIVPPSTTALLINSSTSNVPFTVYDLETAAGSLTVSGFSSNAILLPNSGISLGGTGSNRTVNLTPAPGRSGVAPVWLTVSDGTLSSAAPFALMVTASPQTIFNDDFSYVNGSLITNSANLWVSRSGIANQCQTTNGQLFLSSANTEDVGAPLIGAPYARSNGNVLYASFKLNVLTLPKVVPGLIAHFASGSTQRGRVYAGTTNAAPGQYRVFVANGSDTNTMVPLDLATNTQYTIVTRYVIDTNLTTLWINPVAETDPGTTAGDVQTLSSISEYGFREDTDVGGTMLVDDFRAGVSFAAVTFTNAVSPVVPIPLVVSRSGSSLLLSWSNAAFALQAAPLASGNYTNVSGAASPWPVSAGGASAFFRLKAN